MMLKILAEISQDAFLANNLGFKGGTACYFLYGLDRFSVDLDFDILNQKKEKEIKESLLKILKKFGTIKTQTSIKLKYDKNYQALKIDLSNRYERMINNTYQVQNIISGISLKVLKKEDIFAHKLFALTNRSAESQTSEKFIANRDLYDINFFFKNNWKYNPQIIEAQTKKTVREYLQEIIRLIEKVVSEKKVLERLGDLVDKEQRNWIKNNLKKEILLQLSLEIKALKNQN
jgi:predicted nucleotidyltransferase component of viral defense system